MGATSAESDATRFQGGGLASGLDAVMVPEYCTNYWSAYCPRYDEKRITWDTPVTSLLPTFKLGDAETTSLVKVKHLICACTGLPRQDFEWVFQFRDMTPDRAVATLATMQPTSKFGEMFQYSNPLAGAGG